MPVVLPMRSWPPSPLAGLGRRSRDSADLRSTFGPLSLCPLLPFYVPYSCGYSKQLADRGAAVHDLDWAANRGVIFLVGIDAKAVAEGAEEIGDRDRALGHCGAVGGGGADDAAALDPAA